MIELNIQYTLAKKSRIMGTSFFIILVDFLRNSMCYFVYLYVKFYTTKHYKKLI